MSGNNDAGENELPKREAKKNGNGASVCSVEADSKAGDSKAAERKRGRPRTRLIPEYLSANERYAIERFIKRHVDIAQKSLDKLTENYTKENAFYLDPKIGAERRSLAVLAYLLSAVHWPIGYKEPSKD